MNESNRQLDGYFSKQTEDSEKAEIHKEISGLPSNDTDRIMLETGKAVQSMEEIAILRKRLNHIQRDHKKVRWYWIAATLSFFLAMAYLLITNIGGKNVSNKELYVSYFEKYPDQISTRNTQDTTLMTAMHFYEQGEMAEAKRYLVQIENPSDLIILYIGICDLTLGNTEESIRTLKSLQGLDNGVNQVAGWYLSMAYLRSDNIEAAEKIWVELKQTRYKSRESTELLEHFD